MTEGYMEEIEQETGGKMCISNHSDGLVPAQPWYSSLTSSNDADALDALKHHLCVHICK